MAPLVNSGTYNTKQAQDSVHHTPQDHAPKVHVFPNTYEFPLPTTLETSLWHAVALGVEYGLPRAGTGGIRGLSLPACTGIDKHS